MYDEIFILIIAGGITLLFSWAFRTLPREDWQFIACLPHRKNTDGSWDGINLTYYGFFNALAYLAAVVIFLIMMGSLKVTILGTIFLIIPFLVICMVSARLIARWVEKKKHTFSVGGASFTGIIIGPGVIFLVNLSIGKWLEFQIPLLETMAAIFIAYALGEGIGRLACISFGCCYGKPLEECHPLIKRIFQRRHFVFWGKTKKIAYAQQLEGQAVVPIQALTAVIYSGTGLFSLYLFLKGFTGTALIITLIMTQGWRFVSEFLRADYRGGARISVYQVMTLFAIVYTIVLASYIKEPEQGVPNLLSGIISLWNPGLIIFLVVLWVVSFVYAGKSNVTCSSIKIQVVEKNI